MNDSDLELAACVAGINALAKSAWDHLGIASDMGALHAMEHAHDRRPPGRLWIFG
jgi:hypothetical protein